MNGEFTAGPSGWKTSTGFCFSPTRRSPSRGGPWAQNGAFVRHYGNCFLAMDGRADPRMKNLMVFCLFVSGESGLRAASVACGCIGLS